MGGRLGVAWRAELCDAERTCGVRLAELAPPFDSANPAKLSAIALGPSRSGVDTRDACATRFICARTEISICGNNEHLLAVAAWRRPRQIRVVIARSAGVDDPSYN
jgi:hypothetical protein